MSSGPAVADIGARPQALGTVLRVNELSKTFPGTKALDDVTLEVAEGEIHALVGQNGSGKSTLIKVLAGYYQADPGAKAWLNEEPFDLADTADSRHHRLRFVHQDLGLFLRTWRDGQPRAARGIPARPAAPDPVEGAGRRRPRAARPIRPRPGPAAPASGGDAGPANDVVAIAAALVGWEGGPGVLVLDEPTAVLPPHDVTRLLEIINRVRSRGTSILYVSHRLDEVFRLADRVTVLRGGRVVETRPVGPG